MKEEQDQLHSISLSMLRKESQHNKKDDLENRKLLAYNHPQNKNQKPKMRELKTLNTKTLPKIPGRRKNCKNCTINVLQCKNCDLCSKGEIKKKCCWNLSCIFQFIESQEMEEEINCECILAQEEKFWSNDLEIDWRLMSIIVKITPKDQEFYNLFILQKSEYQMDIYYEDYFGSFMYSEKTQNTSLTGRLQDYNKKVVEGLIKQNCKRYITTRENWQVSNLQQGCQQIIEKFLFDKNIEVFKTKFQQSKSEGNELISGASLKQRGKNQQIHNQTSQIKTNQYQDRYSNTVNQHILFYFCSKSCLLYVKNAAYFQNDITSFYSIRPIRINFRWNQKKTEMFNSEMQKAVWFKDRKGDIFSICGQRLCIYKYDLKEHMFHQIQKLKNPILEKVNPKNALIYIPQKDSIYYINSSDIKSSFVLGLYRSSENNKQQKKSNPNEKNKQQKKLNPKEKKYTFNTNSCTSVNISQPFNINQLKASPQCKAFYILDQITIKNKISKKELTPIIYLLVQKKNNLPYPVELYQIAHNEEKITLLEVPNAPGIAVNSLSRQNLFFNIGVFFPLQMDGECKIYFYSFLQNFRPILLEGRIILDQQKPTISWSNQLLQFTGYNQFRNVKDKMNQKRQDVIRNLKNFKITNLPLALLQTDKNSELILINDIAGISMNNSVRYLGQIEREQKIVEFYLTNESGKLQWKIFDLP